MGGQLELAERGSSFGFVRPRRRLRARRPGRGRRPRTPPGPWCSWDQAKHRPPTLEAENPLYPQGKFDRDLLVIWPHSATAAGLLAGFRGSSLALLAPQPANDAGAPQLRGPRSRLYPRACGERTGPSRGRGRGGRPRDRVHLVVERARGPAHHQRTHSDRQQDHDDDAYPHGDRHARTRRAGPPRRPADRGGVGERRRAGRSADRAGRRRQRAGRHAAERVPDRGERGVRRPPRPHDEARGRPRQQGLLQRHRR